MRRLLVTLCMLLLSWQTASGQAPLEQALRQHRLRMRQLEETLQGARLKYQAGLEAAQLELRDQFEQAIQRAEADKQRKLARRLRLQMESQLKSQIPYVPELNGRAVFESVLGIYGQGVRGPRYPLINLKPPYQAELWSEEVQAAANGIASYEGIDYAGSALLLVPQEGSYRVNIPVRGTRFAINGMVVSAGEIRLKRGVYHIEIYSGTWGQPYILAARAEVIDLASGQRLPFVNTGEAIERFRTSRLEGHELLDATSFRPRQLDIDTRLPATRISRFRPLGAPSLQQILDRGQLLIPGERGEPDLLAPPRRSPQR